MATEKRQNSSQPLDVDSKISEWNDHVKQATEFYADENKQFLTYYGLVYKSSLLPSDIQALEADDRTAFNFPIMKPFIKMALKNVIDSQPSVSFEADKEVEDNILESENAQMLNGQINQMQIADILSLKFEDILDNNDWRMQLYRAANDGLVGAKGYVKISTDYRNNFNFEQDFVIEAVEDPQHVYTDPACKKITRNDGLYQFYMKSFSEEEFVNKYGEDVYENIKKSSSKDKFNWVCEERSTGKKIVYVCEYYYKQVNKKTMYLMQDGNVVDDGSTPKSYQSKRTLDENKIYCVRFCKGEVLEQPYLLNLKDLPYVCISGEVFFDKEKRSIQPFIKDGVDAQRVKNFNMNFFIHESLNNRTGSYFIAKESLTKETLDAINEPHKKKTIIYKQYMKKGNQLLELAKPEYEPASPLPDQYLEAYNSMDQTIDRIFGSQLPSMDKLDMSGKALYNLSEYLSAANQGFMQNLLQAIREIAEIVLHGMPDTLSSQSFKVGADVDGQDDQVLEYDFDFNPDHFHVIVKPGVNSKLQQQATVENLLDLADQSPQFAQFLFSEGFSLLLENMSLNNKDKLITAYEKYMSNMQQQGANQPNPELINAQANMMKAQADQQQNQIKSQQMQQDGAVKSQAAQMKMQADIASSQAEITKAQLEAATALEKHKSENHKFLVQHLSGVNHG